VHMFLPLYFCFLLIKCIQGKKCYNLFITALVQCSMKGLLTFVVDGYKNIKMHMLH
jgi:hypothetical protein